MATTTNYGWTTPDDTALVKDGASAIRTLGSSVDTTTKALNPSTTLGDIEYRSSTANTNTRLGIGTTGQVLSVSGGVPAWSTPSSGSMTLINSGGTTLTGASVSISSIPATYQNLYLVVRNFLPATDATKIAIRYNSDTNTRYCANSTVDVNSQPFNTATPQLSWENDNSVGTGITTFTIFDYANTTTFKMGISDAVAINATTTTNIDYRRNFIVYNQTSAISEITLLPTSGNFTSGTAFLYGVK